ncbi:n-acetyltransferase-related [Holotrichia oblita]|uniref:N-acetyltransferase-related n=1 Tax=Holotrichia oblita TaxID=644536 RepID=A0ACB9TWT9_HOLOL|nr:n-acetyltransferase-related [Holotrichia oblita]
MVQTFPRALILIEIIAIKTEYGLQAKDSPDIEYYQEYSDRCKDNASKAFLSFMIGTDLVVDMFEYCKSDCYLEIMFLGVLSSYRGRSIAYNLCKASENVARVLYSGINIKESITEVPLDLQPFPKFVSAIFTSLVSQKIGRKLEMEVAASVELNQWTYNGKTFADRLGNNPAPIQYCCKML